MTSANVTCRNRGRGKALRTLHQMVIKQGGWVSGPGVVGLFLSVL